MLNSVYQGIKLEILNKHENQVDKKFQWRCCCFITSRDHQGHIENWSLYMENNSEANAEQKGRTQRLVGVSFNKQGD